MPSTPDFGLVRFDDGHSWPEHYKVKCKGTCRGVVRPHVPYFVDERTNLTYCEPCGFRMRYHRKKASERGETEPTTFEDVAKRFADFDKQLAEARAKRAKAGGTK